MGVAVEGELVEHDVPGVTARRVGIGGQADDARAVVREKHFHGFVFRLQLGECRQRLQSLEEHAEVFDLFHE